MPFANQMLGYPPDARLLILNADDFGYCHAVNEAIMRVLAANAIRSTSLMVPCSWSTEAMAYLSSHPDQPFGIHLTAMSDPDACRWGPLTPWDRVPSLIDRWGHFHKFDSLHANLPNLSLSELELEFRAQIERVLAAGLSPTHLDWHAIRFGSRTDIFEMMIRLARAYGLALRVIGLQWIEHLHGLGLPTIDFDFIDSYSVGPARLAEHYSRLLRELPSGLSEWAIHPGIDNAELHAMEPGGSAFRQAEFDFWTSPAARALVQAEGIILLDYRALQPFWSA